MIKKIFIVLCVLAFMLIGFAALGNLGQQLLS